MTRNASRSQTTKKYHAPGPRGSAHPGPLEVTSEGGCVTVSGFAQPPSGCQTQVTVRYDGAALSITASYQAKWRNPVEGCVSLPLDLSDPSALFPILEGEKPWKAWPEIEALVRQSMLDLHVPRRRTRKFDWQLRILRAVRNGPEISKMLMGLSSDKARQNALERQTATDLRSKLSACVTQMHDVLNAASTDPSILPAFSNALRYYRELLRRKQKLDSLSERDRMNEDLLLRK
ncbi:hypothetical protein [Sagittula salina]|uniref:Uncharacterized protein n=1 Tax=Sagittula salina TaxID=2820268 RepID=A0A940MMK4_9RHOB|nr:hypothetical protein [Sagittula salina]MBP0482094.1 hypothetical protein [Sagittula salina]